MPSTTQTAAAETEPSAPRIALPTRVFLMGSARLPDPAPQLPPLDAMRLYTPNYPHLANATLSPPDTQGAEVLYRIEKPPVTTKG